MKVRTRIVHRYAMMALLSLLVACGNKMDEEKAQLLITETFDFPISVTEKFQFGRLNYNKSLGSSSKVAEEFLQREKLVNFKFRGDKRDMFFSYSAYDLQFTPEGEKYVVEETADSKGRQFKVVKVADKVLVDIVEIVEINDGKAAKVKYTWKYKDITPFGEAISLRNDRLNKKDRLFNSRIVYDDNEVHNDDVMMVLLDDGWKIQ